MVAIKGRTNSAPSEFLLISRDAQLTEDCEILPLKNVLFVSQLDLTKVLWFKREVEALSSGSFI